MFDQQTVDELRTQLVEKGSAHMTDANGHKLFLVHTRLLGQDFDGVLLAYESYGAFTFDMGRPLNGFRLIKAGFSIRVADGLADLVNRVTRVTSSPAIGGARKAKALTYTANVPKGRKK